jgi:hypothetical protein
MLVRYGTAEDNVPLHTELMAGLASVTINIGLLTEPKKYDLRKARAKAQSHELRLLEWLNEAN